MKDDYAIGEDDLVLLEDIRLAAHLLRTATTPAGRRTKKAYRDRLIRQAYDQGDVTRGMLAEAAHLSLASIDAIRRAGNRSSGPILRVV